MIVVTGRMVQSLRRVLEPAGLREPVICYQGAAVVDADGSWLLHVPIELELAREAIAAVEAEGYDPNVYVGDELYVSRVTPNAERYSSFQHIPLHPVGDLLEWLDRPPTKLVCVGDPDALDELGERMRERFAGRLWVTKSLPYFLEFATLGVSKGSGLDFLAERLGFSRERTVAFGDGENDVELVEWAGYGIAVENAHEREGGRRLDLPAGRGGGRRAQVIEAYLRLGSRVIDLRAARSDPEPIRAALARKGAAERFDALLAADERWRALVPKVDELRSRLKVKGKPTPEQLEELNRVKEELRAAEEALAAAEAERDGLLDQVPNPPDPSAPDGDTDEDAEELRRWGDPAPEGPEHTEVGRFEMERAARLSGSRFGYLAGDTALLAMALYRFALDRAAAHGHTPLLPPVLVREEAMYGTGFFPTEKSNIYALEADGLYLTGTSEVALAGFHMDEILDELPLATRRSRPAFAASRARPARTRAACSASTSSTRWSCSSSASPGARARSTTGCSRSRRSSCRRSGCRTGSSTSPPATSATRRRRSTTSRRGSRRSSATARSRRPRTRPTSRRGGSASATGPTRSASRRRTR